MKKAHNVSRWAFATFLSLLFAAFPMATALSATELTWSGPATVRADAAALLFSGQNGGDLALAVLPVPLPSNSENTTSMAVFVEVAGSSLLTASPEAALEVEIFVYVLGERNQILAHRNGRLDIDLDQHRQGLEEAGLALALGFEVPPGNHRLRLLVRRSSEIFGLRSMELAIPEPEAPLLLPALAGRPQGRWLTAQLGLPEGPAWAAGAWPPTSRPVWTPHRAAEFLTVGRSLPRGTVIKARLAAATEETTTPHDVMTFTTPTEDVPSSGLEIFRHTLDTTSFTPGIYHLSLASTSTSATLESPALEIFLSAADSGPDTLWTDLLSQSTKQDQASRQLTPRATLTRPRRGELQTLYLEALHHLATGAHPVAHEHLRSLEERALLSPQAPGAERLATAQDAVLGQLVKIFPKALLPLLLLETEGAEQYIQARHFQLEDHAMERVLHWIDSKGNAGIHPSSQDSAHLLNLLAAAYRRRGDLPKAGELFEQALDHDNNNEAALLSLATIHARLGDHDQAHALFSRLLERQPLHDEARLRHALNRIHAGEQQQGATLLDRLTHSAEDWVAVLAFQELARLAGNRNDFTSADQILTRGLARFNHHPGLRLQRAALLERLGQGQQAAQLLDPVDAPQPAEPRNERMRFNHWPEEAIETGRGELHRRVKEGLEGFQQALEWVAGDRP